MSRRRSGGFFDLFDIVELPQRVAGDTLERGPVDLETLRAVARQFVDCERHPGAIGRQFLEGEFKAGAECAIIDAIDQMRLARDLHRDGDLDLIGRSEEHTSELQSLMRLSYAVFCLNKKMRQHAQIGTLTESHSSQPIP